MVIILLLSNKKTILVVLKNAAAYTVRNDLRTMDARGANLRLILSQTLPVLDEYERIIYQLVRVTVVLNSKNPGPDRRASN
jgi:hypothetical protein